MTNVTAPRLHRDRAPVRFWAVACVIAFALAFGMGSVWAEKRAQQDTWATAATYNR
jgi:hypothetical protein